jgi:uncharacterized membrane protein YGL010W
MSKRTLEQWLRLYDDSHSHPLNISLNLLAVPLIFASLMVFLAALPTTLAFFGAKPLPFWANWGVIAWLIIAPFYFRLSSHAGQWMTVAALSVALLAGAIAAFHNQSMLLIGSGICFVVGCLLLFIGYGVEGRRPAFASNLTLILIAPLWCLRRYIRLD